MRVPSRAQVIRPVERLQFPRLFGWSIGSVDFAERFAQMADRANQHRVRTEFCGEVPKCCEPASICCALERRIPVNYLKAASVSPRVAWR
jgi:hypothetical protein